LPKQFPFVPQQILPLNSLDLLRDLVRNSKINPWTLLSHYPTFHSLHFPSEKVQRLLLPNTLPCYFLLYTVYRETDPLPVLQNPLSHLFLIVQEFLGGYVSQQEMVYPFQTELVVLNILLYSR